MKNSGETVLKASIDMAFRLHEAYEGKKKSEEKYRALVENTSDWVWQVDNKGQYTSVIGNVEKIIGYREEEIIGKTPFDFMEPKEVERIGAVFNRIAEKQEKIIGLEDTLLHKNGNPVVFETNATPLFDENGIFRGYFGTCHDITKEKKAEKSQQLNEARLESLLHLNEMADMERDELATFALEESTKLTGSKIGFINFLSEDEKQVTHAVYTAETVKECALPQNLEAFEITGCGLWSEAFRKKEPIIVNNYSLHHPAKKGLPPGHLKFHNFISIPMFEGERIVSVAALGNKAEDYNEGDVRQFRLFMEGLWHLIVKKRSQEASRESERQKNIILNSTSEMVAYYDTDLRIIWANPASAESVGLEMQDLVGRYCYEVWHGRQEHCPNCPVLKAKKIKSPCEGEIETPDGRYWHLRGYPVMDDTEELVNLVEFGQDVTDRRQDEKQLKKSLEEKDYLMKELNHRVKNNLIMINSLINLKAASSKEKMDLSDLTHQIDAIRIVHEKLYQTEDVTHINVREYVQDILDTVFSSFAGGVVQIDNTIPSGMVKTRTAVPLGLIVNEMATNAIKHGFRPGEKALFSIDMGEEEGLWRLTISNSGNPFPDTMGFDNPETLGLRLITALVEQLDGHIQLEGRPQPRFVITLPLETSEMNKNY